MTTTRTLTRQLLASLAATAALLVAAPIAGAADAPGGFAVAPMVFDVDVTPGKSSTYQITITNVDDGPTRYTFSKEDYQGDKDEPAATPVLLGGKFASDISGYDWIAAPAPITIPAGQTRTVPVRVTPPSGATGGHYAALIVEGNSRKAGQIVASSSIGVLFLMNAGGVPPPEIVITEIREVGPTQTVTKINYLNNGTTHTKPKPTVTTTDPITGKPIKKAVGECTTALPGGPGECVVDDNDGTLVGDGGITSGAEQKSVNLLGDEEGTSAKGELPTEWAGAWTSLLLPLVGIALFVLYFLFLRRRRKDEEEGDGELAMGAPLT